MKFSKNNVRDTEFEIVLIEEIHCFIFLKWLFRKLGNGQQSFFFFSGRGPAEVERRAGKSALAPGPERNGSRTEPQKNKKKNKKKGFVVQTPIFEQPF